MIRGGLHVQQGPRFGDAVTMVRNCHPGLVLWVDTAPHDVMSEVHSWGGINVARRYWSHGTEWAYLQGRYNYHLEQDLTPPEALHWAGEDLAQFVFDGWWERFGAAANVVDFAVGANEYWGHDKPATWQLRLAYEFEKALHAKFKAVGVKYAAFSLPPGNCEPEEWAQFMTWCREDNIDFVGDALCVHTYWCSTGGPTSRDSYDPDAPYLVGREAWYNPWPSVTIDGLRQTLPIIIGEYGFDHSLSGKPKTGFTQQYLMPGRDQVYAQHLLDGGNLLARIAEKSWRTYIGWALFTVGGDDVWVGKGFDATRIWQIEAAIKSLPAQHTTYVRAEEPQEPTMLYRTFWLSPVDPVASPTSVEQACNWAKAQTPEGMAPAILWPAVFGPWWQYYCDTNLPKHLCPKNAAELAAIRQQVEAQGVAFGCWVVPRTLSVYEAEQHREAALAAGFIALDLEPYGKWDAEGNWHGFLEPPHDQDPTIYLTTLWAGITSEFQVALSIVPQPSGIDPLGTAWSKWLGGASELAPQCYWSDGSQLHPDVALPYLAGKVNNDEMRVVPIVPSQAVDEAAAAYSAGFDGDLDIWRLLPTGPVEPEEPPVEEPIDWQARALAYEAKIERARNLLVQALEILE